MGLAVDRIPVAVTRRVWKFSKQAFIKWKAKPMPDRQWADVHVVNAALDIGHNDPMFGYRFVTDELDRQWIKVSENRVQRLCREHHIQSVFAEKRALSRKPGPPVDDDLIDRQFTAEAANRVQLTDITEHPTSEGKLYLCAVKDVWSRRIVGYSINDRMTSDLAVSAINNAIAMRGAYGTIVHSDRGSQFRSRHYVTTLNRHGLTGSMGRVGACADNAAMESFFSLLQKNVLDRQRWATNDELRIAIICWIERKYHRRQRQLGRLTPIEYETLNQEKKKAA